MKTQSIFAQARVRPHKLSDGLLDPEALIISESSIAARRSAGEAYYRYE
jgi:hypothetical protein